MRYAPFLLLLFLPGWSAQAQFSLVSGEVRDEHGQPLISATVVLSEVAGGTAGTTTDAEGQFVFADIRPGRYVIEASHVGYEAFLDTLDIGFDERHILEIALVERERSLDEVTVEAQADAPPEPGRYRITSAQLERLPVPGLSADLMGHLMTIPGAARIADMGGHLFVRGGTPTQNLVLVDGMPLYQPFHIVGFYSAFPADIIAHADVYAGGFGARYGGRLSSVIDVSTRNGNKRSISTSVSLAPFLSTARIELPLRKDEVSLVLSGRESAIERVGPALTGTSFPFRFSDYFAKLHAFLSRTSSFSATAIRTFDRGRFPAGAGSERSISWSNSAYGGRYVFLPPEYPAMTQLAVYLSNYESSHSGTGGDRTSRTTGVNGDISFTYFLGDQHLEFGMFARSNSFDFDLGPGGRGTEHIAEGGAFVDLTWDVSRVLHVRSGVRAQAFSGAVGTSIEPRIQLQVRPRTGGGRDVFGVAAGLYRQQIIGLTAMEDLTDVFIAWAPAPAFAAVPTATHLIASWHRSLGPGTSMRTEAYAKWMSHLAAPRYDRLTQSLVRIEELDGIARGLDVQLEHIAAAYYLMASYSLSSVQYQGVVPWPVGVAAAQRVTATFNPPHDRRHQVNLTGAYQWGNTRFRALWQYGSGQPFSQIYGFSPFIRANGPSRDFHTAPGEQAVVFGQPFGDRTPAYHRLDLSADRRFRMGRAEVELQLGVVNAYNRKNLFDFDLLTGERVNQLPLIPYAGVRASI